MRPCRPLSWQNCSGGIFIRTKIIAAFKTGTSRSPRRYMVFCPKARPLITPDELKSIPKGQFIAMKTGARPMRTQLRLFLDWGIRFEEPYLLEERFQRTVSYAGRQELEQAISRCRCAQKGACDTLSSPLLLSKTSQAMDDEAAYARKNRPQNGPLGRSDMRTKEE